MPSARPINPYPAPRRWMLILPAAVMLAAAILLPPRAAQAQPPQPDLPAADEQLAPALPDEELPETAVIESILPDLSLVDPPATNESEPDATPVVVVKDGESSSGGTVYFRNETDYAIDTAAMLKSPCPVSLGKSGVQVLIMHTHGTEAYTQTKANPYTESDPYRTTDSQHNMLRVGQEITDILNSRGISTVHSTTLNDYPAYNGCYTRALTDIKSYVEKYPSIRVIIDVHRDALSTGTTAYKTVANVNGQQTAQLLFVTGTNAGGLTHDNWRQNMTYQVQLHDLLNTLYPGIMRPMSVRKGRFNEHVRTGSMLLEVGTNGNTLEEALAAARIFANVLADQLLGE
ncbi:MAG: stage II sporulation protein P [Clostridiaceae bacterium]|nr:stage II sporulation protein P [Clostridiaceae bacterium]